MLLIYLIPLTCWIYKLKIRKIYIIKIISPFTFQTFKIELNGEEEELRDLIATILGIHPNSIKGIRDSYNNYYTLSSAVKNPHINTNPNNYYTVVIKESNPLNINKESLKIKSISPPYKYSLLKNDDSIYTYPNENNINYHTNFLIIHIMIWTEKMIWMNI